jgi:hypothetical protein
MPIVASDIVTRFTVKTGSAGDTTAGTAAGSLGKYASTTAWAGGSLHDLFDVITGAENAASEAEYRAIYVLNNHATLTAENVVAYIPTQVAGGAVAAIAIDNIAVSAKGTSSAQGAEIADENTAPTGVGAFSAPSTAGTGLAIGNLPPGQGRMVWIRRTAANTAAVDADGFTLEFYLDTPA